MSLVKEFLGIDVEAVRLYRKAAEQGDEQAQYNLERMYDEVWESNRTIRKLCVTTERLRKRSCTSTVLSRVDVQKWLWGT